MNAEVLRRAAALMRERAEASAVFAQVEGWWTPEGLMDVFDDSSAAPIQGARQDAEQLASWNPVVALAVALLLENEANAWESQEARVSEWPDLSVNPARRDLLTSVARAYLGDPA